MHTVKEGQFAKREGGHLSALQTLHDNDRGSGNILDITNITNMTNNITKQINC